MRVRLFSRRGQTGRLAWALCFVNLVASASCNLPDVLTYRAIEPCSARNALLVIDHTDNQDQCVRADKRAFKPLCRGTFHLEVKPGKDRCRRLGEVRSSPSSTAHYQDSDRLDVI